jgi:hypothetical protein
MLLWGLINAAPALFVPFTLPKTCYHCIFSPAELDTIMGDSENAIIFVGDSRHPRFSALKETMLEVSLYFHSFRHYFYSVEASNAEHLLRKYDQEAPSLFFIRHKSIWLLTPCPSSQLLLLFMVDDFITQNVYSVQSLLELFCHLGHFHFCLLVPPELLDESLGRRYETVPFLGMMDVILCGRPLLSDCGVQPNEIGLYRQEDGCIESIPLSFDAIMTNALPRFSRFVPTDFSDVGRVFAALLDTELLPTYGALLFDLAGQYPNFTVGFLRPRFFQVIEHVLPGPIGDLPTFVVFSVDPRMYYPKFQGKKITQTAISGYLDGIVNGSIKEIFHSEPLPDTHGDEPQKLVGQTYWAFINNTDHDRLILYLESENDKESRLAFSELQKAVAELAPFGLRAGFIDVGLNSSPIPFPKMRQYPQLRFFSAGNRTDITGFPFFHRFSRDDIVRFVKRISSIDYRVYVGAKQRRELGKEVKDLSKFYGTLPEEDQEPVSEYFRKLWIEVNKR